MLGKLFNKLRGPRTDFPPDGPRHWIIDQHRQVVRVTYVEFDAWRNRHHGGKGLTVGEDEVDGTKITTLFTQSNLNSGKDLFHTAVFDKEWTILEEHGRDYNTWKEAERGHAQTVENIRANAAGLPAKPIDVGTSVPPMLESLIQETLRVAHKYEQLDAKQEATGSNPTPRSSQIKR